MAEGNGTGGAVTTTGGGGFLATEDDLKGLQNEVAGREGQGTSGAREDNVIPFLSILQDMSPQVKKREDAYIEGAEPGMIMRTDIRRVYTELIFQPCTFSKRWNEWVPRDAGGGAGKGFVGSYPDKPDNAKNRVKDGKVLENAWYNPDNGNDYVETRYHFGNIINPEDGSVDPAVIGLSGTQHTVSRQWMALIRSFKVGGVIAPSFFRAYRLTTIEKSNTQGTWFVFSVHDMGWVAKKLRDLGAELHDSVESGEKVAAEPADTGESRGDQEVPF